jgi:hypothetical protein
MGRTVGARPRPTRWPRTLRASAAAEYAGYTCERDFLLAVNDGSMPPAFVIAGAQAWDILDLDAAIDSIKAGARRVGTAQQQAEAYAQRRRVAGRSR